MPQGVEVRVLSWAPDARFRSSETVQKHHKKPGFLGFFVVWRQGSFRPLPLAMHGAAGVCCRWTAFSELLSSSALRPRVLRSCRWTAFSELLSSEAQATGFTSGCRWTAFSELLS